MSNFQPQYIKALYEQNRFALMKTISYFFMHIFVAFSVAFYITQSFWMAISLSLLEPIVQAFAYFFHEKFWAKKVNEASTEENNKSEVAAAKT